VELDQRRVGRAVGAHLVADGDEDQRAGAADLADDVVDRRRAHDLVADPDRAAEGEPATGPHPPRQLDRGQEAAATGVPVRADLGLLVHGQEVEPVPQRRQRRAGGRRCGRVVQGGGQGADGCRGDGVDCRLGATDPGRQVDVLELHSQTPPR
jgi:hypothetical protein